MIRRAGDWLYVTGEIGDAALALQQINQDVSLKPDLIDPIRSKLDYPKHRVLAGQTLREYASAAIDISDGLIAGLRHICQASNVGANIVLDAIPLSNIMRDSLPFEDAIELALTGGDDYELLFTVSEDNKVGMETSLSHVATPVTCIGQINASQNISSTLNNKPVPISSTGFEHFSTK